MHSPITDTRLFNSQILIVEDDESTITIIKQALLQEGYHRILIARNGQEALDLTRQKNPDLVILDILMPVMDGHSYCKEIRADHAFDNMPILVQTVLDNMKQKLLAFEMGASDYICKPIYAGELTARIKVHLTQKLMMQDLAEFHTRMSHELEAARLMQNRLMPNEHQIHVCERVYDMQIAQHYEPSSIMGGDCWGMRAFTDTRLAIYMFDFSGHGITAAMNVFRMHTIMQDIMHTGGDPGTFLTTLNRHIHPLLERDEFATMFYGVIDTSANCLQYATAASPPAMVLNHENNETITIEGRGFPLGVVENATFETHYVPFSRKYALVLFSDCLIETPDSKGAMISEGAIEKCVKTVIDENNLHAAAAIQNALTQLLRTHNPAPVRDDMTLNVYYRK